MLRTISCNSKQLTDAYIRCCRGYVVDYFFFSCSYISPDKFIIEPRGVNEQLVISRVSKDVTIQGIAFVFLIATSM